MEKKSAMPAKASKIAPEKSGEKPPRTAPRKAQRTDVGARNPYAFVEHVLGVKIDWEHSSPTAIQRLIEKINDQPFYSIFDDLHAPIPEKEPERGIKENRKKQKKPIKGGRS